MKRLALALILTACAVLPAHAVDYTAARTAYEDYKSCMFEMTVQNVGSGQNPYNAASGAILACDKLNDAMYQALLAGGEDPHAARVWSNLQEIELRKEIVRKLVLR